MSKVAEAFFKEIHSDIDSTVDDVIKVLFIDRDSQDPWMHLIELSPDEKSALQKMSLTEPQVEALRKAIRVIGRSIVFHLMCIIDGVAFVDESIPDLALVDRNTKKDIADQFLHDEFTDQTPQ